MTNYYAGSSVVEGRVETFRKYRERWAELLEKEIAHYDRIVRQISDNYEFYRRQKVTNVWSGWDVYVWGEWFRYLCRDTDEFGSVCGVCPISHLYGDCYDGRSPFYRMSYAKNWGEWLKYAEEGRDILRRLLEKCRKGLCGG